MKRRAAPVERRDSEGDTPRARESGPAFDAGLAAALDRVTDGIVVVGPEWRFQYLNEAAAQMLGAPRAQLQGATLRSYFGETGTPEFSRALMACVREGRPFTVTEYYAPLDRWFESRGFPQGGTAVVLVRDITERLRADQRLQEYSDRMAEAERIAHFGVWRWELPAGRVRMSGELCAIFGLVARPDWPSDVLVAQLHPDDRDRVRVALARAREALEPFAFEHRIIRADGEERSLYTHGRAIIGPGGEATGLVGVCHDITERAEAERELGLREQRMRALLYHSPSVVSVKDRDGRYLLANAAYGRLVGMEPEEMVGRLCDDLFPSVAEEQRARDARALEQPDPVYDESVLMVGSELRTFDTVTFAVPDADGRMVNSCTIGTDVTERRERESERRRRLDWVKRIESALAEGRMLAYAQPIVDITTGARRGCELLVRMRPSDDPEVVLEPRSFLPEAERYGLIQAIDVWMVERALELSAAFDPGVNLSAVTLSDVDARDEILGRLRASPAAARRLVFEITETAIPEHLDAAVQFSAQLTSLGCGLALDDFGTGFGSFTYLRRLPVRSLKIDRSFVRELATCEEDRAVVQSVVSIAERFRLQTIAEGVEDAPTLALLGELGSHYAQGYHVGRPAPTAVPTHR